MYIMCIQAPPPRAGVQCRRCPGLQNAFYHLICVYVYIMLYYIIVEAYL